MLELLAPAGNLDAVIAAVQNGADAVYMGFGDGFNARRSADNFTRESFAKAVRYCHIRGCKVYVTLNTLVGDREMDAAAALAQQAEEGLLDGPLDGLPQCRRAMGDARGDGGPVTRQGAIGARSPAARHPGQGAGRPHRPGHRRPPLSERRTRQGGTAGPLFQVNALNLE